MLAELPSPVTGGTMLTVEDMQQEFVCNINIKHRCLLNPVMYSLYQILKELSKLLSL